MKAARVIRVVIGLYLVIGVAGVLVRYVAPRFFEPKCEGVAVHTMSDESLVKQVFLWLPSFYRETIQGEMTMRNYLLGGYRCASSQILGLESLRGLINAPSAPPKSISETMKEAGKTPQPGSKAAAILDQIPKRIEYEKASFELPPNWTEKEVQVAKEILEPDYLLHARDYDSPDNPSTVRIRFVIWSRKGTDLLQSPEFFAKRNLQQLEKIGLTKVEIVAASSENVGAVPGMNILLKSIDSSGRTWEYRVISAFPPERLIQIDIFSRVQPVNPFREDIERVLKSIKIAN